MSINISIRAPGLTVTANLKDTTLPAETVRQEARKLREHSRQAVEQSKAARQRQRALRNK